MIGNDSSSRKIFAVFNYIFLCASALLCIFPIIHIAAVSLSSGTAANAGLVKLIPVGFTVETYKEVLSRPQYYQSYVVTLKRLILGVPLNMTLTVMAAYPISKSKKQFRSREFYVVFLIISILFSGGIIPLYVTVYKTGLIDTIWALIIPGASPVFNIILLQNAFKQLPNEIEEASIIDGASQWTILWRMFLPLSKPALATLVLFCIVGHWNSWFDGMIYMNRAENYPLQTYLQTVVVERDIRNLRIQDLQNMSDISERNNKAAQIFITMLPILLVYPFLQKYFAKGIILGSVKG
ncbi:MAG: carbohydrate ABC transporter permease [Clostridia bacterium]|nr:carbohydrate ABC transporter permease [Clostridia bacterium]